MLKAFFVTKIIVTDPILNIPVEIDIYREERGGLFGVDSSYIATELPVISPFNNGKLQIVE